MGFTEILTIIFIVLKLLGVITWAWWVCLLPEIIAGVLYVIWWQSIRPTRVSRNISMSSKEV